MIVIWVKYYIGDVAYYIFDSNIPLMAYSLNKLKFS